jgi:hypothetical protein
MNRRTGLADAYGRYAELISAQLEAVDAGDLDTFARFAHERTAVARAIDDIHAEDPEVSADVAQAMLPKLEAALLLDVRLRERLELIHDASLDGARSIDRNRVAIRSYGTPAEAGANFDLSF